MVSLRDVADRPTAHAVDVGAGQFASVDPVVGAINRAPTRGKDALMQSAGMHRFARAHLVAVAVALGLLLSAALGMAALGASGRLTRAGQAAPRHPVAAVVSNSSASTNRPFWETQFMGSGTVPGA